MHETLQKMQDGITVAKDDCLVHVYIKYYGKVWKGAMQKHVLYEWPLRNR